MYNIIFLFLIVNSNSLIHKPNLCINCNYFISDNKNNEYSKCSLFKLEKNNNFLVTGKHIVIEDDYYFCSTARNTWSMCGEIGRGYVKKAYK